jgi:glutamate carboxypeptidase
VGENDAPPILLLGHFDTVWPLGTIRERPFADDGRIARGPGVFDMKAGLIQGLWAIHAIRAVHRRPPAVRVLFNSDEEIQSVRSRSLIEATARTTRAVLVLEPSLNGALKTARKGVGRFEISIRGRAAHAGVEPGAGRSAIGELARVIDYLHSLNDAAAGVSVNVGLAHGGTRANVVAANAHAVVDVRVVDSQQAEVIDRAIRGWRPSRDGIEIEVTGGLVRPPMPRTPAIGELFAVAHRIGRSIDLELSETSTGGGSDANFCAALGVPVLDGLGADGGGAHAVDEHVLIESIPSRATMVAGLISQLEEA